MITSSRRIRGGNSVGMQMSLEELTAERNKLATLVIRSETFFQKLETYLLSQALKKGPSPDPHYQKNSEL